MYASLISCGELQHLMNSNDSDLVIIDCRFSLADTESGRRAYAQSHLPGAFYAHLDEDLSGPVIPGKTGRHPLPTAEAAARLFSSWGIGAGTQVVVYDDMSGAIAARLWWMLRWLGHGEVAVLDGGWPAWLAGGGAVSTVVPARSADRGFTPRPRPELIVDAPIVERISRDRAFRVVDSRTPDRYRGEVEPIDPVAGHIPGALNIPHSDHATADGAWLTANEIRETFRSALGDAEAEKTVFYCGSGVTACRNLLAYYHAGLGEAKLYAGSWSEWITDEDRGVARS